MKNRTYILLVLIGLLSTCTAGITYAQRGHGGGGGHFGGGGGSHFGGSRVMSAPRTSVMSAPRVSSPRISSNRIVRGDNYAGGSRVIASGTRYYPGGYYHGRYYGGGYYYRHPWYRPYYHFFYPPIGFYVSVLPYGYFTLGPAFGPMYYYQGTYYQPSNDERGGYKVTDAPLNAEVPNLPDGAQEIQVNGNTYYDVNGTYYQEIMTDNGRRYKVVGKNGKIGDQDVTSESSVPNANNPTNNSSTPDNIVSQLPEGCRTVTINGQELYLSPDGMYYQLVTSGNTTGYKVVGKINAEQ
ncbi:DUF6515 family protein [Chitinophaga vietnamensis]|uniref:DUF6515 family protein n=1 Tax=Chitinophaga vietnamensis TaxID=2593957 RepID=UPI0011788D9E|nr:DUF6515 family protein [Chitinophaga vietnamensis]